MSKVESELSQIAGRPVEVTVRGEKSFTFSWAGQCAKAEKAVYAFFFGAFAKIEKNYDEELDETFVWLELTY